MRRGDRWSSELVAGFQSIALALDLEFDVSMNPMSFGQRRFSYN